MVRPSLQPVRMQARVPGGEHRAPTAGEKKANGGDPAAVYTKQALGVLTCVAYGQRDARRAHAVLMRAKTASLCACLAWNKSLQESNANALEVAAGLRQALDAKLGSFETSFQVTTV